MITLNVIGTGSSGNCYLLDCDGERLVLDAGVKMADIKTALMWDITGIEAVLVTHSHTDHNRSENGFRKMGLPVFAPYKTPDVAFRKGVFGNFIVNSFPVPHNDTPNYGFLIRWKQFTMIYLTDLEYCKYTMAKQEPNCILVECNYVPDLVDEEADNFRHIIRGHASLDVTEGIVRANFSEELKNVILCHLSDVNADETVIVDRIRTAAPMANVSVAHKGEVFELWT